MPEHIGVATTDARLAILTGDPTRVGWLSECWGSTVVSTGDRRGFRYVEMDDAVVLGTGIGAPSMAIVAEELIEIGVERLFRIGTCGALTASIRPGDLVIPSAVVRDDGTSAAYLADGVPAVPDGVLLAELVGASRRSSAPWHVGVTHCKDAYYAEKADRTASPASTEARWDALRRSGVLATEMETAALFAVAQARGAQAAAIFVNVGSDVDRPYVMPGLQAALEIVRIACHESWASDQSGSRDGEG